jgi:17beta-estradiol 17-dehydrogenase / 3beta-hydroxysteroid 3-dehydrogenase
MRMNFSMDRWRGKIALVTGASSGIGAAIAKDLAAAGLKVALAARSKDGLAKTQAAIAAAGGTSAIFTVDLRKNEAIHGLFDAVRKQYGPIDVLINNAGLAYNSALSKGREDDWREMVETNILAVALCCQEGLKDMEGKADAGIINISSLAGHRIVANRGADFYAATKFAVRAMTDGLRFELSARKSPVKIGMISPGVVASEFNARAHRTAANAKVPFEPLTPEDISSVAMYMLSTPRNVQIHDVIIRPVGQEH